VKNFLSKLQREGGPGRVQRRLFFGWSGFVPFGEVYKYREQGCSFFCEVIIYPYWDFRDDFFGDQGVFFKFFQLFAEGLIGDGR